MNRRTFVMAAGFTAAQSLRVWGANERVRVAVIGLGGRGRSLTGTFAGLAECEVAALCDVDQAALERAEAQVLKATNAKPASYKDMKQVFDAKNIDGVVMPLPNHWHALSTIWACQAGKDVYVEKPACHNIYEGGKMIEAARKYGRMVQIGSQHRSMAHKQKAIKMLAEGVIGKVYMAKGLCYKKRPSIGKKANGPVPAGVDWDKFLGPAPMRPFNENRFKYNWHWFWDTGNGDIGNQGIHEMDIARWGLGRDLPAGVVSTGGKFVYDDDQETPNTQIATFDYGDAQIVFEVRGLPTGSEGTIAEGTNVIGDLFYGSEGWMALDQKSLQIFKGPKNEKVLDEQGDRQGGVHMKNFLAAVKSRKHTDLAADVETGVRSAALVHMANISYRLGRKLSFDVAKLRFVNDDEANKMLTRPYRAPYVVPEKV